MKHFLSEKLNNILLDSKIRVNEINDILYKKNTSFATNDYFGLAKNCEIKARVLHEMQKYHIGTGGSKYVCGNSEIHLELEERTAFVKNSEDCVLFGSGYLANVGVISAICGREDLVIADKLVHASIVDGIVLSRAKMLRFEHNNLNHLEEILRRMRGSYKRCTIVTETIFSMIGSASDLDEVVQLAIRYDCFLISDDAHGLCNAKYRDYDFHAQIGTYSKAVGSYGGYACCGALLAGYIRNFARSQVYSTSLPFPVILANLFGIEWIASASNEIKQTPIAHAKYFDNCSGLSVYRGSQIVFIEVESSEMALAYSRVLEGNGFIVPAIRPPTVPKAGLRISFCADHKKIDIEKLSDILRDVLKN